MNSFPFFIQKINPSWQTAKSIGTSPRWFGKTGGITAVNNRYVFCNISGLAPTGGSKNQNKAQREKNTTPLWPLFKVPILQHVTSFPF